MITGLDIDIFPSENWLLDKFFYLSFFSVLKAQCWTAVSMATEPYLSYSREYKACEIRTVENVQPFKYECWVCCFTVFTANSGLVSFCMVLCKYSYCSSSAVEELHVQQSREDPVLHSRLWVGLLLLRERFKGKEMKPCCVCCLLAFWAETHSWILTGVNSE